METNFQIIKVDETEHWSDEIKAKVGKIYCVYLYDKSVVTHCAEITPSYELRPLYYTTEFAPHKFSEEVDEQIQAEFSNEESVRYFHCSSVDKMEHYPMKNMLALNKDIEGRDNDEYNELVESTVEYFKCNHTF